MSARTAGFFDPATHLEALVSLATTALDAGDGAAAYAFADRRRRLITAKARDLLTCAEAARLDKRPDDAVADLTEALAIDPTDPSVNRALLAWGPPEHRADAARRLIASDACDDKTLAEAVAALLASGEVLIHRTRILERERVSGWVLWTGERPPFLVVSTGAGQTHLDLAPDTGHRLARLGSVADVAFRSPDALIERVTYVRDGAALAVAEARPAPPRAPAPACRRRAGRPPAEHVMVVVPVYGDFAATKACLLSLVSQQASIGIRIVVVDDASPDLDIRALLDEGAARGDYALVRNPRNLGFVGAVNVALARHDGGDVLLLNADAVLPSGAIERLRRAVYSRPDIGTATPLSNNGEYTSFPKPYVANPLPALAAIEETDQVCARVNAGLTIALPSGVGFCLYVRRDCYDAVGLLSTLFAPGYGEDIEFCLVARERGFANVCAADVFVGHAGSRSFAAEKRAHVVRGLRIVDEHFPDYRLESAALLEADPLREARAAVERALPPAGPIRFLVAGSPGGRAAVKARASVLRRSRPEVGVITLAISDAGDALELRAADQGAPQNLAFALSAAGDHAAFARYAGRLDVDRIEIADPGGLTDAALEALLALGRPVDLLFADASWLGAQPAATAGPSAAPVGDQPCPACSSVQDRQEASLPGYVARAKRVEAAAARAQSIRPMDVLSAAAAPRCAKGLAIAAVEPPAAPARSALGVGGRPTLGVFAPIASAAVDRLLIALGRAVATAKGDAAIVVLGACLDDLAVMAAGDVAVTGRAEVADYARIIAQRRVTATLSPYRSGHFWLFDAVGAAGRWAYFDWSFGAFGPAPGDCALDPRLCDEKAARAIAAWLLDAGQTDGGGA